VYLPLTSILMPVLWEYLLQDIDPAGLAELLPQVAIAVIFAVFMYLAFKIWSSSVQGIVDAGRAERTSILESHALDRAQQEARLQAWIEREQERQRQFQKEMVDDLRTFWGEERVKRNEAYARLAEEIKKLQIELVAHDERSRIAIGVLDRIQDRVEKS